jgi:hypothetical protein
MPSDLNDELSAMTGARQTMSSWAKVIESPEAMHEVYRSSFSTVLGHEPTMPYTVFAPAIAGLRHRTTEKLLCVAHDTIYVWERAGGRAAQTAYPLETISDLEMGEILLFSWITIGGVTQAGKTSATTIEFNTATSRHFARLVSLIRPAPDPLAGLALAVEQAKFGYLTAESFKFGSFACSSLVEGEQVHQIVWQPKIRKPLTRLGRFTFYQTLSLPHVAILTDKEFIVIQDDERSRESRGIRYGGKWRYIALKHIGAVAVSDQGDDMLTLSLTLAPGGRQIETLFTASLKEQIARLESGLKNKGEAAEDFGRQVATSTPAATAPDLAHHAPPGRGSGC